MHLFFFPITSLASSPNTSFHSFLRGKMLLIAVLPLFIMTILGLSKYITVAPKGVLVRPIYMPVVDPQAIYDGNYAGKADIKLRIGNGGAGQSGLIKILADEFIKYRVGQGDEPFRVAWYLSDSTVTVNYLAAGIIDVGFTYSEVAEKIAIAQGVATERYYAWRDHFYLVGPKENPANISKSDDILTIFSDIYKAASMSPVNAAVPVRFLSRYDKSATNIKESQLWIGIGQVPWATSYSTWYHTYINFPIQALTAAILLKEYTITDRGTFLSIPQTLQNETAIYKAATDDQADPLLNPAHLLIGAKAEDRNMAQSFKSWVIAREGQAVIKGFQKAGEQLYSGAPELKMRL